MRSVAFVVWLVCVVFSPLALAEEEGFDYEELCGSRIDAENPALPELAALARTLQDSVCDAVDAEQMQAVAARLHLRKPELAQALARDTDEMTMRGWLELNQEALEVWRQPATGMPSVVPVDTIEDDPGQMAMGIQLRSGSTVSHVLVVQKANAGKQCADGVSCYAVVRDAASMLAKVSGLYHGQDIDAGHAVYSAAYQDWLTFATKSRQMTIVDAWLTGCVAYRESRSCSLFKSRKQSDKDALRNRKPPRSQWFLLHPMMMYEWTDSAAKGDRGEAIGALEVVGFNRWNAQFGDKSMPWGASIIIAPNDRAGFDSGPDPGVMLTIDNRFQIGAVRHESDLDGVEAGFFVSLDLLKSLEQTHKKIQGLRR